ncbi:hypothetical protein C368_05441 [Cryptococcus neoformans 125.91]|nr:hypothetical protein C368_05441 [Cryptococcus neoformans var. grubii 125.91]
MLLRPWKLQRNRNLPLSFLMRKAGAAQGERDGQRQPAACDWHSVRENVDVVVDLRHGGADWWIVRDIGNVDRKMLNRKRVARRKDKDRIAEA